MNIWLDGFLVLAGLPLFLATGYLALLTLLSGRNPVPLAGDAKLKFDIVVPAHDEAAVIERTVASLKRLDWPAYRILVVADNCTDDTAQRAAAAGAVVLERSDPTRRGKGYALEYAYDRSCAEGWADAVVVVDADTEASTNLLAAFAARISGGAQAVQAHYGVLNVNASWRTRLMTIALAMFHVIRSRGRERLGVSCGLRGNGMCFTRAVLIEVPHRAFSLVEDLEYGIQLGLAGHRVVYAGEAEVLGEMVSRESAARSQRQRWEGGRFAMMRSHGLPLLREAVRKRSGLLLDLAMDVLLPPLGYVGLGVVALLLVADFFSLLAGHSLPAFELGLVCVGFLVLHLVRGVQLSGLGWRGYLDLLRAPGYVLWKLLLRLRSRHSQEWIRTDRE